MSETTEWHQRAIWCCEHYQHPHARLIVLLSIYPESHWLLERHTYKSNRCIYFHDTLVTTNFRFSLHGQETGVMYCCYSPWYQVWFQPFNELQYFTVQYYLQSMYFGPAIYLCLLQTLYVCSEYHSHCNIGCNVYHFYCKKKSDDTHSCFQKHWDVKQIVDGPQFWLAWHYIQASI